MLMEDIKRTVSELEQDSSLPAVGVELVDNELATLYMNSRKSEVTLEKIFYVITIHSIIRTCDTHRQKLSHFQLALKKKNQCFKDYCTMQ